MSCLKQVYIWRETCLTIVRYCRAGTRSAPDKAYGLTARIHHSWYETWLELLLLPPLLSPFRRTYFADTHRLPERDAYKHW